MARPSVVTVRVRKPDHASYAETMNRLRVWLDTANIEPVAFRSFSDLSFEFIFRTEREAALFEDEFG